MKSGTNLAEVTESYAERRRAYVAEIRNSFEDDKREKTSYDENREQGSFFLFAKIQLLVAAVLFCLFLFLKLTDTKLYGYSTEDVVDMITDNHYYTKLQEYDILHISEENKK